MSNRFSNYFIAGLFILILTVFSVWSFFKPAKSESVLENRKLAQKPGMTAQAIFKGEYTQQFDTYFNDQFPMRDQLIEANALVDKYILRKNHIRGVYINEDGYMISPVRISKADTAIKNAAAKIDEFSRINQKMNIPVYFALAPNKSVYLEDKLPDYIESHANEYTDTFIRGLKSTNAIDLRSIFEHDDEQLYFYTDHHWKLKAAFYSYQNIIKEMAKTFPSVGEPLTEADFKWYEYPKPFYGSQARKTTRAYAKTSDTVTVAEYLKKEKPWDICYKKECGRALYNFDVASKENLYLNRYIIYIAGDVAELTIKNPNKKDGLNVLILKDSYANPMLQFLARHFYRTRVLDLRLTKVSVYDYIQEKDIDAVLFIHNINFLGESNFVEFEKRQI